jgi:hypothetical protein
MGPENGFQRETHYLNSRTGFRHAYDRGAIQSTTVGAERAFASVRVVDLCSNWATHRGKSRLSAPTAAEHSSEQTTGPMEVSDEEIVPAFSSCFNPTCSE